jgi:hypothetical protein
LSATIVLVEIASRVGKAEAEDERRTERLASRLARELAAADAPALDAMILLGAWYNPSEAVADGESPIERRLYDIMTSCRNNVKGTGASDGA